MSMRSVWWALLTSVILLASMAAAQPARVDLQSGWQLASTCQVKEAGEAISTASYHPEGLAAGQRSQPRCWRRRLRAGSFTIPITR